MSEKQTSEARLAELLKAPKRRRFVIAYVENGGNATAAAESAGYAVPNVEGARLLRDASVIEAIEAHTNCVQRVAGESRDTVLNRIRNRANANIQDFFREVPIVGDDGAPVLVNGQALTTNELIPITQLPREVAACIKAVVPTAHGTKLELHDASAADRDLARLMGLEPKEQEALSADDAAQLIAAALDRMDELDHSPATSE